MRHYRVAPYKLHNKVEDQWADYFESGYYFEDEMVFIPIDQIDYRKWNQGRYDFYMDAFSKGKSAEPVRLADTAWMGGTKYQVGDGNHRIAASVAMGYTHVPAIVARKREGKPPGNPPRNLYEAVHGRELLLLIEYFRNNRPYGSQFYFQWGSVEPSGYWLKVSDETDSVMRPYEEVMRVFIDGDERKTDFQWRGKKLMYRGNLEGLKRKVLEMMEKSLQEERKVAGLAGELVRVARALLEE